MYEDVLFPFDGSAGAAAVLHHAAELANWDDATVHVLFVADTTRDSVTVVDGRAVDALVRRGEDVVAEAEGVLQSLGVDYRTDVVQGNPAPTIADYAERYDHDLVVMPTHGRDGVSRYLVGSVTEKVVRLSDVPVLTARTHADDQLRFPYEDILIPTDGSAGAAHAAEHGLALASALGATVHALSVVDDAALGVDVRSSGAVEAPARDAVADVVAAAEAYDLGSVVEHVEHGSPVEGILACVEANDVDAVVMGTTGRRGTDRILLGSVAEKAVRSVPVPVVTVREPASE
ncbi:universal stress protein [Haloarcula onubensis]|uniref:Universal stress protein n=1 Tax=Haloarcula onubensis TaxID=2950539 RepID=A0ABU2FPT0_9EURY|nr:universal stress protein [Halomicroarcula sp. S3CR25-11]MDS0282763.1 universal stress protein [Halomicroarcula sp. S3CR25-11]